MFFVPSFRLQKYKKIPEPANDSGNIFDLGQKVHNGVGSAVYFVSEASGARTPQCTQMILMKSAGVITRGDAG